MSKKDIDVSKYFKPNLKDARIRKKVVPKQINFKIDENNFNLGINKKYLIKTFGCQGNEADTEVMKGILEELCFKETTDQNDADIIILNTCAIRETAENKVWGDLGRLGKLKRNNPDLILGVAGCMSQEEVVVERLLKRFPFVDLIFGTHNIYKLPEYIQTAMYAKEKVVEVFSKEGNIVENLPKIRSNKYKAWVNIMFGCDEFCTYCIVPYTRGKERSRLKEEIIKEVKDLVENGYQEITLLGQNVNAYGKDFKDQNYTFGDLLYDLNETGINRIRFTTSHPHDLDLKTINAIKNSKHVMPHFHLPVQAGGKTTLRRMNRRYTKESYLEVLSLLKKHVPDISVTTDIIVGFPGETEEEFLETLDLVKKAKFEGAYTFIFSAREGTPAFKFEDNTTLDEKKSRLQRLNKLVNKQYLEGNKRFLNKVVKVLVDGTSRNNEQILAGYTEHNKLVNFKGDKKHIGSIVEVKITSVKTWFMNGEIYEK